MLGPVKVMLTFRLPLDNTTVIYRVESDHLPSLH